MFEIFLLIYWLQLNREIGEDEEEELDVFVPSIKKKNNTNIIRGSRHLVHNFFFAILIETEKWPTSLKKYLVELAVLHISVKTT